MKPTASHRATPKAPPLSDSFSASITDELHRYDEHLRDVRGLAAGTRKDRLLIAGLVLQQRFKEQPVDISSLRPDDVRQFLARQLETHRTASNASRLAAALRSYFRYRATCGDQVGKLTAVILNPVLEAGLIATCAHTGRDRAPAEFLYRRVSMAEARLRHYSLRIGLGTAVVRNSQPEYQRYRLACRHGDTERHQVAAAGHPTLADGNRAGTGRLSSERAAA